MSVPAHLHCLCGALSTDESGVTSKAANDFNDDGCKSMADAADLGDDLIQRCLVMVDSILKSPNALKFEVWYRTERVFPNQA